ncbi:hypothetical protein MUU74_08725 [Chryseobacterium daecheongense]|uniref:hypothetical protein n=1 Tax=Chryseobacterium daecheongense TaxID=192389 RepID=UPI001FD64891|nr:hypothetical protein [Chryseobacterium daecheongense]UOV00026.1 hypothetical protein MUU74_08725 [Chryseobacterium daecheongense]
MQIPAISVDDYISKIPEERQEIFKKLFDTIDDNLPEGFKQGVSYGMVGWDVPLEIYPSGYHCTPGTPLPFMGLASQKKLYCVIPYGNIFQA